mgnify:CR=1 FL=1
MNEAIWAAVLGCIGTVLGSGIGAFATAGKTNFRLDQLEKKMDKTTELVERLVMVEARSKNNSHRLEELERNEYA